MAEKHCASGTSHATTRACRSFCDTFLLNRHPVFVFLRLGPLCNASRSFSLTNAYCDIERIKSRIQGLPEKGKTMAVDMDNIFARGFQVLQSEEENNLSSEERNALNDLQNFLQNIEVHQQNLLDAIKKMKTDQSKQTALTIAVAEHLFSKLASGYSYRIDERMQGEEQTKECKCEYEKPINFAATGIGHSKVWHGHVDIIMSESKEQRPVGTANIVTDRSLLYPEEDAEPTIVKSAKLTDDDACYSITDRTFSQTIVFALAQKQLHPDNKSFIPNILITEKEFYIVMYDPFNDILIRSEKIPLWSLESSSSLELMAIIILWMVLHYKMFCSNGGIFENLNELKAYFMDHVTETQQKFYKDLDIGVVNFEEEKTDEFSRDLSLHMFDYVKLKS